ncbi:hypothetical protein [Actinoplanes sp. HUAS TT8]|uniref:hypothetical protein n=1 Tax=Actinoplanes sp. HUAS TT8 TaxID=3447453 RepID=UPI003F51BFC7
MRATDHAFRPLPALTVPESALVEYARTLSRHIDRTGSGPTGWAHRSSAHLLLVEGRLFTPAPGPAGRRVPSRNSYRNAAATARRHGLLYAEGMAATLISGTVWSFPHAWCVTSDGRAIDPTWEAGHGLAYLGIAVADPDRWPTGRRPGSLLEDYPANMPLLRDGLPAGMTAPLGQALVRPRQVSTGPPGRAADTVRRGSPSREC